MFSRFDSLKGWILSMGACISSKTTYPCNKPLMRVDQIFLTDIILSMIWIPNRTELLNISTYFSMRCTKVTKQLKNSLVSQETWSKTWRWVWKIMDFLVHINRLTTPSSLSTTKFRMKGLCYKSSSNFHSLEDTECKAPSNSSI